VKLLKERDEILAVATAPYDPAWCSGVLPSDVAPPDAVLWLAPVTLGKVISEHQQVAIRYTADYSHAIGAASVLSKCVKVDRANWRLGEATAPPQPEKLDPVWTHWRQVAALGDGTAVHSIANRLLTLLGEATGFALPDELPEEERSFEAFLAHARQRGRWITGVFPQDLEAAVYLRPYAVTEQEAAQAATEYVVEGKPLTIDLQSVPVMLAAVIRSGPEDRPVMTPQDIERLPYGTAMALNTMAYELTQGSMEDRLTATRFRRDTSARPADPGDQPATDLVGRDASAPGAARAGGMEPAAVAADDA
jgi:hypothetical protein